MAAVTHNYLNIVKYLLKLPEIIDTINHVDHTGRNCLEYADLHQQYHCLLELLKVPQLDRDVLLVLYEKYKKKNPNASDNQYHVIHLITQKIRKYLHIPSKTKTEIKKLRIPDIKPSHRWSMFSHDHRQLLKEHQQSTVLDVDLQTNPHLFSLIYRPVEKPDQSMYVDAKELMYLANFNQFNPELIYQPQPITSTVSDGPEEDEESIDSSSLDEM